MRVTLIVLAFAIAGCEQATKTMEQEPVKTVETAPEVKWSSTTTDFTNTSSLKVDKENVE